MKLFFRQIFRLLFFLNILLIYNSCLEPIEFNIPQNLHLLVVDGKITNSGEGNTLKLSRTTNTDQILEPVFGATIKIFDDLGREEHFYPRHDLGNGIYFHPEEIVKGEPGLTYYIEITLLEDGSIYRSRPETMPFITATDSIYFDFTTIKEQNDIGNFVDRKLFQLYTDTKIEPQNSPIFLKWDVEEAYKLSPTDFPDPFGAVPSPCYITTMTNSQNIILFNGEQIKSEKIQNLLLAQRRIDFAFLELIFFNVKISSITPEAYNYWKEINQVVNNVGSIFDSPPAPVRGNIFNVNKPDEPVLGFFQATSEKISRIKLRKIDIPFFIPPYCEYMAGKTNYPDPCLNCLSLLNSSLDRPYYFD